MEAFIQKCNFENNWGQSITGGPFVTLNIRKISVLPHP